MISHSRSNPGVGSGPQRYPGTFLLAFREAMVLLSWKIERWRGDAVDCRDATGEEHTVGLENLFRRVRREERTSWPTRIAEFLTKVRAGEEAAVAETDLNAAADRLLVRLGQPFAPLPGDTQVWTQPLAGTELRINLVLDHAETMSYVTDRMITESGKPGEEWVQRALSNLRARTSAANLQTVHEESGLSLCTSGDAYDASRALVLDCFYPAGLADGCFVAVPSRDELFLLPVSQAALENIHLLKVLAERTFKGGPYPISEEVYWIHEGRWHLFPITVRQNEVTVRPPEEFNAILDRLSPEDASEGPEL